MGIFKRLCLFVFSISGLVALAALALPWYGPWMREASALMGIAEYYLVVELAALLCVLGLFVCLLRSIFVRNRKVVIVADAQGDAISVTRDAIASQASHIIEEDGTFHTKTISVRAGKRGHVRVFARIQPIQNVDVVNAGQDLHERLVQGIALVCGDNVDAVNLEFLRADEYVASESAEGADEYVAPESAEGADEYLASESVVDESASHNTTGSYEITVPMTRYSGEQHAGEE